MKENLTELVFILDRSGSMHGLERETIGGFNSLIEKQKLEEGEAYVSTVLFDNVCEVIHDRLRLADIPLLTGREYYTRGTTALLDAVGGAVKHIANIHKYARREDIPSKTLFVITTDGMENASRRYSYEKVKKMIEREKAEHGWEFLFLGANIDAAETAVSMGIPKNRASDYFCDAKGTELNYMTVCSAITELRCDNGISDDWCEPVAKYMKSKRG